MFKNKLSFLSHIFSYQSIKIRHSGRILYPDSLRFICFRSQTKLLCVKIYKFLQVAVAVVMGIDPSDDEDATTVHGCDDEEDYEDLLPLETDMLPETSAKPVSILY